MIIIEGPEGSGKSRLADLLRRNTSFEVHHFGAPPSSIEELDRRLDRSREMLTLPVIQDRSPWVSEPIYSVLLGQGPVTTWPAYVGGLRAMNAKVIYCRPPDETIRDSMCQSPKTYKNATYEKRILLNASWLISLYDDFMDQLDPWIRFDWTLESGRLVEKRLVRLLEEWRSASKEMDNDRDGEGDQESNAGAGE